MKQLNLGILGCGRIALSTHLPVLSTMPNVKIVALAEPDSALRDRALAFAPSALGSADWRELIAREDVDAVVICLPSGLHAEAGIAAFRASKHAYVEKPVAGNLADAQSLLDAWKISGCVGMTGFNYRFHPLVVELKRQIQTARIGKILGARSVFTTNARDLPEWKAHRRSGGGALLDLAAHHVDLIRFLFQSEIQSVFGRITSVKSEGDTATLDLRTANAEMVQSFFSLRSLEENRIDVFGEAGRLSLDLYRSASVEFAPASGGGGALDALMQLNTNVWERGKKLVVSKLAKNAHLISWQTALAEFVASASQGRAASCDLNDGYASLAVIDTAERSAEAKISVDILPCEVAANSSGASPLPTPEGDRPAISVILSTPGVADSISTTLRALLAQTIRDRIELVLVVESTDKFRVEAAEVAGLGRVQVVEIGYFLSRGHANAKGIRAASASIVVLAEDHSFPEPSWAAALVEAHRGPWAAVAPLIINANPDTAISCADLLLGYGLWIDPALCGERSLLPGHNTSYKRQILLEYSADLESMLEAETLIQWDMRSKGLRLYQTVEARTRHVNFSLMAPFCNANFQNGRAFAAARARGWNPGRRAFYCVASPLIPFVRFFKILRDARRAPVIRATVMFGLPALALALFLDGLGQMLGYGFGPGNSAEQLKLVEFNRVSNITATDRALLFETSVQPAVAEAS